MPRQIVLDTETTGLRVEDGHKIIEVGCIELIDRKFTGNNFHTYLNPERTIDEEASKVHGLTNDFVKDKPNFASIAEKLIAYLGNAELIIHNAGFDLNFLDSEFRLFKAGWKSLRNFCQITDTLEMARKQYIGQRNNLDALCKRLKIDNSKREFHGALLDAHLTAQVYLAMTGGQGTFFEELQIVNNTHRQGGQSVDVAKIQDYQLVVLKANQHEEALHQEYLDKMRREGTCVWQ